MRTNSRGFYVNTRAYPLFQNLDKYASVPRWWHGTWPRKRFKQWNVTPPFDSFFQILSQSAFGKLERAGTALPRSPVRDETENTSFIIGSPR